MRAFRPFETAATAATTALKFFARDSGRAKRAWGQSTRWLLDGQGRFRRLGDGRLKLDGEEHEHTLQAADNYVISLMHLERFKEAKSILRKTFPMARRVLGASNDLTIRMARSYAKELHDDPGATLDDLREAVATLEDTVRTARRVLGGAHPLTVEIGIWLRHVDETLRAREA